MEGLERALGQDALAVLLEKLRRERGMDFRNYRASSLRRRIQRRMAMARADCMDSYLACLDRDPGEYDCLIRDMTIGVTAFFRDSGAFRVLEQRVVPALAAWVRGRGSLRVWCAGCATGEEVYSMAILLREALGDRLHTLDIRIYATDMDEVALVRARRGEYEGSRLERVPQRYLDRHFQPRGSAYVIREEVRRLIAFGVHNLATHAPISHIDLLVCRNVLIYFERPLQERVLRGFHYALRPGGFLFLGKSECLAGLSNKNGRERPFTSPNRLGMHGRETQDRSQFIPFNGTWRIYRKPIG